MTDEDLQFESMDRGRYRSLIIAVGTIAVLGTTAYVIGSRMAKSTHDRELRNTATAWSSLRRCLVGEWRPAPGHLVSRYIRKRELAIPPSVRDLPPDRRLREWPYRCAAHASTMTHSLFAMRDDQYRLVSVAVSRAAGQLERGELRTGDHDRLHYLDELFESVHRASLPDMGPGAGPLPPGEAPLLELRTMRSIHQSAALSSTDAVTAGTLRLVLTGAQRALCEFPWSNRLQSAACLNIPHASTTTATELLSSSDQAAPLVLVRNSPTEIHYGLWSDRVVSRGAIAGFADNDAAIYTLLSPTTTQPNWQLETVTQNTNIATLITLPSLENSAQLWGPSIAYDQILLIGRPSQLIGTSPIHVFAAPVRRNNTDPVSFTDMGVIPGYSSERKPRFCRTNQMLTMAIPTTEQQASLFFLREGRWSGPQQVNASLGALTCNNNEATLTWGVAQPTRRVHQVRCTPDRCTTTEGPLPDYDHMEPIVTDLAGKVLLIASPGPGHGLRMRLGPIERLDQLDDTIILDDADHGGINITPNIQVHVRQQYAVVIVQTDQPEHAALYAIRIGSDGQFQAVDRLNRP